VLSIATFAPGGMNDLPKRWEMAEEIAAENGKTVDRKNWRLVFPVHLADSKEEALKDIREGANAWIQKYFVETLAANIQFEEYPGQPPSELTIDRMAARGGVIIGTPDDAIARIEEAIEASGGGFGGLLILAHEWASREKTLRSYELWARYVAPHFQGSIDSIALSNKWTSERREMLMGTSIKAIMKSIDDYKRHREEKGATPSELADRPLNRIRP
jgi:limonene 1,2-monooxygenase